MLLLWEWKPCNNVQNVTFGTRMLGFYYTKWSRPDRERQISYDITFMWNLKKKRYKWTYTQKRNRPTDIENKLMVTKREREGEE